MYSGLVLELMYHLLLSIPGDTVGVLDFPIQSFASSSYWGNGRTAMCMTSEVGSLLMVKDSLSYLFVACNWLRPSTSV